MSQVVDFLNEAKTYYLATTEQDNQARVRPFGATMEYEGHVYFATNNTKKVFHQLVKNPKVEVSGMANGQWIRLSGNAVVDETRQAKEAMLNANPFLKSMYNLEDGVFAVFYLDDMKATLYSMTQDPIVLEN